MKTQFGIFPWNKNFEVAIPVIDEQHQKLVMIINRLATGVAESQESSLLEKILGELNDYAAYHFKTEEGVWHQYLPNDDLETKHHVTHENFLEFLDHFKLDQSTQSIAESYKKLITFLTDWLVFHILESDKNMADMCLAVKSGRSLDEAKTSTQATSRAARKILADALINMNHDLSLLSFELSEEIKQRQRAEASLKKALYFSKSLTGSMQDGFVTFDRFGAVSEVNPAFCAMLGYSTKELVGLSFPYPFCPSRHQTEFKQGFARADGKFEMELPLVRKNGEQFPAIVSMFQVQADNDQLATCAMTVKDISERKMVEAEKSKLSFYDALTNLANRRLFDEQLNHATEDSQRTGKSIAVLFMDLDHFKQLNDTKGHAFGDKVLKEVAQRLKESVRAIDTVSRFGGDEFVVLLTNLEHTTAQTDVELIARKILSKIAEPYCWAASSDDPDGFEFHCTASIGVVISRGREIEPEAMISLADHAMYAVKAGGRNAVQFYDG